MTKQQKRFARNSCALEGAGMARGLVRDLAALYANADGAARVKREHLADARSTLLSALRHDGAIGTARLGCYYVGAHGVMAAAGVIAGELQE
jgi:hypothetical protein